MLRSLKHYSHNTVMVNKRMTDCNTHHATKTRHICCGKNSSEEAPLRPSGKCVVNAEIRLIVRYRIQRSILLNNFLNLYFDKK
jgi:hypothetical protein